VTTGFVGQAGFRIDVVDLKDSAVVGIAGELDLSSAPNLYECLNELISLGTVNVYVDAQELSYADSTALSVFVLARNRLKESGGRVVVRHPNTNVRKLFEVTGLDALFFSNADSTSEVPLQNRPVRRPSTDARVGRSCGTR
jgi:anti-sigma B factor antagonist